MNRQIWLPCAFLSDDEAEDCCFLPHEEGVNYHLTPPKGEGTEMACCGLSEKQAFSNKENYIR